MSLSYIVALIQSLTNYLISIILVFMKNILTLKAFLIIFLIILYTPIISQINSYQFHNYSVNHPIKKDMSINQVLDIYGYDTVNYQKLEQSLIFSIPDCKEFTESRIDVLILDIFDFSLIHEWYLIAFMDNKSIFWGYPYEFNRHESELINTIGNKIVEKILSPEFRINYFKIKGNIFYLKNANNIEILKSKMNQIDTVEVIRIDKMKKGESLILMNEIGYIIPSGETAKHSLWGISLNAIKLGGYLSSNSFLYGSLLNFSYVESGFFQWNFLNFGYQYRFLLGSFIPYLGIEEHTSLLKYNDSFETNKHFGFGINPLLGIIIELSEKRNFRVEAKYNSTLGENNTPSYFNIILCFDIKLK